MRWFKINIVHVILALPMICLSQEPGIPSPLHTVAMSSIRDTTETVRITAGSISSFSYTTFDKQGKWQQQSERNHLSRIAFFVAVKRSLGKYFEVGFCLPWYHSSLRYNGMYYQQGTYTVEQISDIRLFTGFHLSLKRTILLLEAGTNIPIGNGLPTALHPAFPPGENGYLSFWGKAGFLIAATNTLTVFQQTSIDMRAPRSGAIIDTESLPGSFPGNLQVIQATIKPGDRLVFQTGITSRRNLWSFSFGYSFLYQFQSKAQNIFPETTTDQNFANQNLAPRSVLHTLYAAAFLQWNKFYAGFTTLGSPGGFNSWGEWTNALTISFKI
jgi:hypothetical protein